MAFFRKAADKKSKKDGKTTDIRKHLVRRDDGTQQQSTIADESDEEEKEKETQSANLKNYRDFFRELDLDIWTILLWPLTLNPAPENVIVSHSGWILFEKKSRTLLNTVLLLQNWEFSAEFGPSELLFVVEDMVEKINFVLITSTRKNPFKNTTTTDIGLTSSSVYVGNPEKIVKNVIKLIPVLCSHMETLSKYCNVNVVRCLFFFFFYLVHKPTLFWQKT